MSLILAATDRAELVQTLGTELVYFGHQVQLARTGRRLLDDLDTDSFDIAVIDLLLPDIDGYEIARQIRLRSSMPIMMLVDTREDIDEAPHRTVSDFVLNPIDSHALDLRVTAILR
ncbi:response regulator transcription factor [Rhodococcus sp. NPDC059969]|uniref:response regulator transcription factor n=1 Tax=Rhodococcus sp. NPDC059969 TaxID=3347018 RepID=UPI00366F4940